MLSPLPYITTTTEIQRKPSVLKTTEHDRYRVITSGSKKIGVFLPMKMFYEWERYVSKSTLKETKKYYLVPPKTRKLLSKINPVEFQRDLRKEY